MSDLVSLKITIKDDANYLLFGDRICRDMKELEAFCKCRYQVLEKTVNEFRFFWIDDDGDEIRVTTDEDYRSFLQAMANTKARLFVVEKKPTLAEPGNQEETDTTVQSEADVDAPMQNDATDAAAVSSRPLHQHVICDVCDEEIVGHRYKCLSCHDYDLCMSCEAKFRHKDHLMLRIPKPAMVCRSNSTVSRMYDKLRMYSARITSNMEKDAAAQEPGDSVGPGNDGPIDANGMKRAYARSGHRSKHSEERRANTEPSKPSRSGKPSVGADRKQTFVADVAETKEKRESATHTSVSEMAQRYRDTMMYLNATEGLDPAGNQVPWNTTDHVAVANLAAATAKAAAAIAQKAFEASMAFKADGSPTPRQPQQVVIIRKNARKAHEASKAFKASGTATPKQPVPAEPTPEEIAQMLQHANGTMKPQKPAPTVVLPPPPPTLTPATPFPFLPFVNLPWPSQEKLMVASENVSKLLDPLGLSFEIRHKSAGATSASSPGGSPKARDGTAGAATVAAEAAAASLPTSKKSEETIEPPFEKKQEQRSQTTEPQQAATTAAVAESSSAAQESKKKCATSDSNAEEKEEQKTLLESDAVAADKVEEAAENAAAEDEDDSQNCSSASLLTDDDQDLLEVDEDGKEDSAPSSKPPKVAEKSWTLIDIPHENDEEKIAANVPLDAIAKLIGQPISATTGNDKEEPAQTPTPLLSSQEKKREKTPEESKVKEMKKVRKVIGDQKEESELPGQQSGAAMKESEAGPSKGKGSRKSITTQKDTTVYSHRPHVNHAIHTMMTMGFSNHNGWLTQLLESLNGDIPKALDLLLQHRH